MHELTCFKVSSNLNTQPLLTVAGPVLRCGPEDHSVIIMCGKSWFLKTLLSISLSPGMSVAEGPFCPVKQDQTWVKTSFWHWAVALKLFYCCSPQKHSCSMLYSMYNHSQQQIKTQKMFLPSDFVVTAFSSTHLLHLDGPDILPLPGLASWLCIGEDSLALITAFESLQMNLNCLASSVRN